MGIINVKGCQIMLKYAKKFHLYLEKLFNQQVTGKTITHDISQLKKKLKGNICPHNSIIHS